MEDQWKEEDKQHELAADKKQRLATEKAEDEIFDQEQIKLKRRLE